MRKLIACSSSVMSRFTIPGACSFSAAAAQLTCGTTPRSRLTMPLPSPEVLTRSIVSPPCIDKHPPTIPSSFSPPPSPPHQESKKPRQRCGHPSRRFPRVIVTSRPCRQERDRPHQEPDGQTEHLNRKKLQNEEKHDPDPEEAKERTAYEAGENPCRLRGDSAGNRLAQQLQVRDRDPTADRIAHRPTPPA